MDKRFAQTAAMGFLGGKLESKQISLERLEDFAFDEKLYPIDGQPLTEPDKWTEADLKALATSVAKAAYSRKGFSKERVEKLMYRIGQMMALGKITPISLAVLCGISSEGFDEIVKDYFRDQSQK